MTYTKDTLRQIFQQPFNQEGWQNLLENYFHASELRALIPTIVETIVMKMTNKVSHLYGLTYDEVFIVDSETPITREEYEKK